MLLSPSTVDAATGKHPDEFKALIAKKDQAEMETMEKEQPGFMEMFMEFVAAGQLAYRDHGLRTLRRAHAGQGLVHQQQAGLAGERLGRSVPAQAGDCPWGAGVLLMDREAPGDRIARNSHADGVRPAYSIMNRDRTRRRPISWANRR